MKLRSMNILIVEDHEPTRERLAGLLADRKHTEVMAAVGSAEEALDLMADAVPDLVILDLGLPGLSGANAIKAIKALYLSVEILVFTVMEDDDQVFASLQSGASGYLLKDATQEQILASIDELQAGGAPMSLSIARRVLKEFRSLGADSEVSDIVTPLSSRESVILEMLYRGDSYKEIADKLNLSIHTVHTHIRRTYEKLHVNSRSQAIYEACRRKIIKH